MEGMSPSCFWRPFAGRGPRWRERPPRPPGAASPRRIWWSWACPAAWAAGKKRLTLLKKLGLPEHMSPNAMLQALNLLYTREGAGGAAVVLKAVGRGRRRVRDAAPYGCVDVGASGMPRPYEQVNGGLRVIS